MTKTNDLRPAALIGRAWLLIGVLCAGSFLAACGGSPAPPVDTPAAHSPASLSVTRTLPPTWTPTSTFTPLPPTLTPTITPTPTATPTRDPARLCQDFELLSAPLDGASVGYDNRIAFSWRGAPPGMIVRVILLNQETDVGILVQWDSQQALNMTVDMALLPDTGVYDWTLSLYEVPQGDRCPVEGWFVRLTREESITPATEAPPSEAATPAPTGTLPKTPGAD